MYKELFDEKKQNEMQRFFLDVVSPLGNFYTYNKNQIINIDMEYFVAIVTKGRLKHCLCNDNGGQKVLYFLKPGEIFGETDYFADGNLNLTAIAMESTTISVLPMDIVNKLLYDEPLAYSYFIHSITRKYRISIFQMSDTLFNSSKSKVASTLYRLSLQDINIKNEKYIITTPMTHEDLSHLIGCSRVTVTRVLKSLRVDGVLSINKRQIIINDINKLKSFI